jgi:hypothetical protein
MHESVRAFIANSVVRSAKLLCIYSTVVKAAFSQMSFSDRGFDSRPIQTVGRDHWFLGNVRTGLHGDVQPALPVGHL